MPDFETHLTDSDNEDQGVEMDPVSSLWRCLRKGTPLVTLYNSIKPLEPLKIDEKIPETKRAKIAAFKFVEACLKDLKLPPGECFSLQDLFGDDTTGFVKVCSIIVYADVIMVSTFPDSVMYLKNHPSYTYA